MSNTREDNLPEVVPDAIPQALSQDEAYERQRMENHDEKVPHSPVDDVKDEKILHSPAEDGTKPLTEPSPITPTTGIPSAIPPSDSSTRRTRIILNKERRVCGLRKRNFWIILAVVLAVIVAVAVGVGVGVGVTRAKKSSSSDGGEDSEAAGQSEDSTPSATSSDSSSSTSSPEPTPSFLNNMTDSPRTGFAFQGYSEKNYGGDATDIYYEDGFYDLPFDSYSYIWFQNDTGCCLTFCQDKETSVGWWCHDRRRNDASSEFSRIFIGCGADAREENSRCDDDDDDD